MNRQVEGAVLVMGAMAAFSLMSTFVKLASSEVSSIESVFVRGLIGCIWIYAYARRKKVNLWGIRKGLLRPGASQGPSLW